jgi:hypothetical protein
LANPSVSTTYTLTATNTSSGCTSTDVVIVTVNISPPLVFAGNDQRDPSGYWYYYLQPGSIVAGAGPSATNVAGKTFKITIITNA